MDIIGVIDGGSTKTDFFFINPQGELQCKTKTIGFNPLLISSKEILKHLQKNDKLEKIAPHVNQLYYYGAGAQTTELQNKIHVVFQKVFNHAEVHVDSDMTAAAYAAYNGKPTLVGILGTGCNTCFFDGIEIHKPNPSLGYVLGDEGSGNHIGRNLLRGFYANKFPQELENVFKNEFNLQIENLLQQVYQKDSPNAYLASFAKFAVPHQNHPYIENLVAQCFQEFFEYQVYPYHQFHYQEINFIGSIAHHFKTILSSVAQENNLLVGHVVEKPIEKLVSYHLKYKF